MRSVRFVLHRDKFILASNIGDTSIVMMDTTLTGLPMRPTLIQTKYGTARHEQRKRSSATLQEHLTHQRAPAYEDLAMAELRHWQASMQKQPTLINKLAKRMQRKINRIIPERIHRAMTLAIKQMVRSMLFGAAHTTRKPLVGASLEERERRVRKRISIYQKVAATEGGVTGAGGFWMAMADFPAFLGIKMKLLYEIAALYGHDVKDYRERLYLLKIFQLAFSSQGQRNIVYAQIKNWEEQCRQLSDDIHAFDWRTFQLEYRDYLDLAKLAQMLPGIGAVVGLAVNYRLTRHLGKTAMHAYRMRWESEHGWLMEG